MSTNYPAQIEDAMLELIKTQSFGYSIKTVASYGGELSGDANAIALMLPRFPAVWVTFKGEGKPISYDTARKRWLVPATFSVFAATRNARGELEGRKGNAFEVGAYQIINDIRQLFVGRDLGPGIDVINPGGIKVLFNTAIKGNCIVCYAVELTTKYYIVRSEPDAPDLLRIGIDYDLTPPRDGIADASDLLTLETST
ncbi:MAG: DUF1834 family protein [Methylobacter tundripaludum]|nr:DUF1834 family protein [Methylobacter tundripaludum]